MIVKKRQSDEGVQTSSEVRMKGGGLSTRHKQHLRHSIQSSERIGPRRVSFGETVTLGECGTGYEISADVRSNPLPPRMRSRTKLQREAATE